MIYLKKKYRIIFFLCFFCITRTYSQVNDSLFSSTVIRSIALTAAEEQATEHHLSTGGTTSLFIFLSPDCPLCRNYSSLLNGIYEQYSSRVSFYGIIPGRTYTEQEIQDFRSSYQIRFPVYTDTEKQLSNYLKISVTPEVVLLDKKQELLYRGAIDDRAVGFGKQKQMATRHYLADALQQGLQQEVISIKRTQPVGCRINDF